MPKIPRISLDSPSAGIPGAAPLSPGAVAAPLADLTNLAGTVFDIASTEGKRQANEMRAALEAKQAIVNEVDAGRRSGDYEEDITGYAEKLKKEFWDNPDKAPAQLLEIGRTLQDRQREQAPNTQVGLEFVQRSNARLAASVREMHDWALSRQSQKAKGDLSVIINRATAGAESIGSVPALGVYITAKEKELTSVFQNVLGTESQTKMAEMRSGMVRAWAQATGNKSPEGALSVLQALDSSKPGNPLVDNLKDTEREALRKDAKADFAGGFKNKLLEEVKKGVSQNRELFDLTMAAPQEAGGALYSATNALEEQAKAAKAQMHVDTATLEKWGIDLHGHSVDEVPQLIDDRLRYVRALNYARRTMIGFDAEDDPAATEGAILAVDKALKKIDGKTFQNIVKQQADLAVLHSDKKIKEDTFSTLFKTMLLALDTAAQNNEPHWYYPNTWRVFAGPMQAGRNELAKQFDGQFSKVDKATQNRVKLRFMQQFQGAQERGTVLKQDDARKMALRVLSLETSTHIQGVE